MHIRVLGGFEVRNGDTAIDPRDWRLRRARHLVAILALAPGQRVPRDRVLEDLWPECSPGPASHNLHQAMYVARRALRRAHVGDLLTIDGEQVVLAPGHRVPVDAVEFEDRAADALDTGDTDLLAAADALYRGDLLPELPYADWTRRRRAALRELHHAVLVRFAEAKAASGRPETALPALDRVLAADPVHEGAVRVSMRLLAASGRRSAALARYEELREDLLDAFGTDPDEESRLLFRDLLDGR